MFEYAVLLWLRHRAPIFPVVLYLQGGRGLRDEEYRESLFGRELFRFRYAAVGLAHLWAEEYVDTGPLGAALAVLMRQAKRAEPVLLEAGLMRRVGESGLDPLRKFLLINIIETYSRLSAEQRAELERLLSRKEYRSVLEVKETWSERMRNQGIVEGKRETLLRQLTAKLGSLRPDTIAKVAAVPSAAELDVYLDRILTAESLEDIGF